MPMPRASTGAVKVLGGLLLILVVGIATYSAFRPAPDRPPGDAAAAADRPEAPATPAPPPAPAAPEPATADIPITIEPSGLHWVAITKLPYDLGHAMDVEAVGGDIFIVTSAGYLTFYDPISQTFKPIARVEQNRLQLRRSKIRKAKGFVMAYFRTFGLFVEARGESFRAYVAYHRFEDDCFYFEIATLTFALEDGAARILADWQPLYTSAPCIPPKDKGFVFAGQQGGGRIVPLDSRHLLVSIGDHELDGNVGPSAPLDPASSYGKIVLLDRETGEWAIFAAGLRNPQGLFIADDGRIYATDHGPMGGDELDVIERGKSYGWPNSTYGIQYGNRPWPLSARQGRHDEGERPLFAWLPSIAVSNLTQIEGDEFPLWQGDLIVSTLKMKSLYRLRIEDGRVMYVEQIPVHQRIRDIERLPSGELLATTDSRNLLIISDAGEIFGKPKSKQEIRSELPFITLPSREPAVAVAEDAEDADTGAPTAARGRQLFENRCASCHRLDGEIAVSVNLDGLFGRRIGSVEGYAYSPALAEDRRPWSPKLLKRFLIDRSGRFAETSMPEVTLRARDFDALAEYLSEPDADSPQEIQ